MGRVERERRKGRGAGRGSAGIRTLALVSSSPNLPSRPTGAATVRPNPWPSSPRASHAEAAKEAGASRRSFYDALARDPDFGRACQAVYEVRVAAEMGTRAELIEGLRELSGYFAYAADQLERSSFAWFSLREGLVGALEELDKRLERRGLAARPELGPEEVVRALEGAELAALPAPSGDEPFGTP